MTNLMHERGGATNHKVGRHLNDFLTMLCSDQHSQKWWIYSVRGACPWHMLALRLLRIQYIQAMHDCDW